jgi:putative ABC transport system substrate-binding protein
MNRRDTLLALVVLGASPLAAKAQQPERMLRIGILSSGTIELRGHLEQSLLESLRERGFVEGKNLMIERRYGGATWSARASELAGQLAAMNLDVVLTTCTPSTAVAKQAMQSTSIVMLATSDPVGYGLITSLARPGANITGLSSQGEELLPKMLQYFSSILPPSTTVALLGNSRNPVHARMWKTLSDSAQLRDLNIKLARLEVSSPADFPAAFDAAVRDGAGALFVLPDDPLMLNQRPAIIRLAAKHRMPDFYWAREFVDEGGLMSYGENLRQSYRSATRYIVRLAAGAKPGDLPVEQPTKFELVINRKTANTLGLTIPQLLLVRADEVIQ